MNSRFDPATPVITRSFAAAVFLHGLGHPVIQVRSQDGSPFSAHWHFPPKARADLARYYGARDALTLLGAQHLGRRDTTNHQPTIKESNDHGHGDRD